MLAKRVQDTAGSYSPEQIIAIAGRYAMKNLEDAEFFAALCQSVMDRLTDFNASQLASFLLSCSKLRYLDEDLTEAIMKYFLDASHLARQNVQTLATALTAAALL